jgi:hypothetical protein
MNNYINMLLADQTTRQQILHLAYNSGITFEDASRTYAQQHYERAMQLQAQHARRPQNSQQQAQYAPQASQVPQMRQQYHFSDEQHGMGLQVSSNGPSVVATS